MAIRELLDRPWDSLFKDLDREREAMCIPTLPCVRYTPYGEVEGMKCALGTEINHNTTILNFKEVISDGALRPGIKDWTLGQDAVSFSACPPQSYAGVVKMVFDSARLASQLRSMCYVDFAWVEDPDAPREEGKLPKRMPGPWSTVEKGMDKESSGIMNPDAPKEERRITGSNRIAAKYAIGRELFSKECEYISYQEIPLRGNLKRLEYWIPLRPHLLFEASFGCSPGNTVANPEGYDLKQGVGKGNSLMDSIELVKAAAETYGVDFEVKSCFPLLHARGWHEYIELNPENLEKLKQGIIPESKYMGDAEEIYDREKYPCLCE